MTMKTALPTRRLRGAGSISRRDGRWVAVAPKVDGVTRRVPGRFDTYREAERALAEFVAQMQEDPCRS